MQQEPAAAGSPGLQQDPVLPHTPTMPPPESPSEGHQPSHSPAEQSMEEEFQFLHCQGCQAPAKCPKLLPCLHTLCSGCLEAPGLQCPICQAPRPEGEDDSPPLDNIFFESLQRRLSVYRQILDAQAACTRCREPADFWCFECEQLLCSKCFEAHQWFLKHEARPLAELRSQSAREFLDGTRKSNNIFCSNPNHRTPALTSIYCRGCSKPLCCSCALLDRDHSDLKCDISAEIQQRQEELDTMAHALQEQDSTFSTAHAEMRSAIGQLGRARADTEELISTHVRQVVAHVLARERELLDAVNEQYQRDYQEMASQLRRLDAVLQRIRTGGALVQRMKRYASDQEVLDMHDFVHKALNRLRQEEPQSLQAALHTDGFEEFKIRLQDFISCITQGTDAAVCRRASPETAGTPREPFDVDLEVSNTTTPQKRKSCHTQCSRKVIKLESEEDKEARLASSSPEQARPSTSKAVSPPHSDGPPSPESPIIGKEVLLPNNNHVLGDTGEAEERIVVISSSEDSDAENSSSRELEDSSSESSDLQLEGPSSLRVLDESLADPRAEDRPLVFFDLKIDNETQKISQLAAVNRESKFRVLIQPEAFSIYSKAVSLEVGLQHFLSFLSSMRRPILACYKLWGPGLPNFFQALEDINRLWEFQEAISGFLAALPLIRERVPGARSFKLKSLAKTYLARNMSERSALAAVLAMRDLCRLLEVSPGPQLAQHVYPFSSLQCFASLQPLVQAAVLPRAEARLLALHNVSFLELLTTHRSDPQRGLKKFSQYLSPQTTSSPSAQPAFNLQALSTYLEGLLEGPALAQAEGSSTPLTGHSLAEKAKQS
ncbi:promyelocytic leukemia, transcript variant X2 [Ictidomys tridecemlineatus]|uniref:protein PML isoform X3 n=1 Tax=Ictidomys tridecemlineatus TaxID=43179 RepID=UPI000B53CED1|nr:protein PML isoform X3 [Ictidomys tridecemlineatus]KAG3262255.1 promyelocytic leukemia, transcript variant X2 [Ictidomys tridecemlineatus]